MQCILIIFFLPPQFLPDPPLPSLIRENGDRKWMGLKREEEKDLALQEGPSKVRDGAQGKAHRNQSCKSKTLAVPFCDSILSPQKLHGTL